LVEQISENGDVALSYFIEWLQRRFS